MNIHFSKPYKFVAFYTATPILTSYESRFSVTPVQLPLKSLIRCTSLSKSYLHLITSPAFIKAHLALSTSSHLLLRYFANDKKEIYHFDPDTDVFSGFRTQGLLVPFNSKSSGCFTVVGCVNGVICLVNDSLKEGTSIILWNPSIRKYVDVPEPHYINGGYESACGFGYDSISDDYKVVRVVRVLDYKNTLFDPFEVYSLKSGCWRPVGTAPCYSLKMSRHYYTSCFLHGSVYWAASKWVGFPEHENVILKFDVSLETFEVIEMPRMLKDTDGKPTLFYVQECWEMLGIICQNYEDGPQTCSIWVMKGYGVVNSWSKIFDFSSANLWGMRQAFVFRKNGQVIVMLARDDNICFVPGDEEGEGEGYVVIKDNDVIVSIDPLTYGTTVLGEIYGKACALYMATYVESMELFHQGKRIEDLPDELKVILSNREQE